MGTLSQAHRHPAPASEATPQANMADSSAFDDKQYDQKMGEIFEGEDAISTWDEVHETFDAMGLHENLLRGIYAYGFEKPSAIQQRGIVPFAKKLDVIQQAQSGTGKTATFCAGILQNVDYEQAEVQALVLAPTRAWVARRCARTSASCRAACTWWWAPPVVCMTCS